MKRTMTIAAATATAIAGIGLAAPSAHAEERVYRGSIGAATVDNLRVPQGATCRLNGTFVKGTIKAERNAVLLAEDIRVIGNVQAENHQRVRVISSRVDGSIQLKQGGTAAIRTNRVGGDVQSFTNEGRQVISSNRINRNLKCKSNRPAPVGGGNVVGGNKEDQCRRL